MDDLPPLGAPGQRLGRYELLQRIAVGGMAEVYRAYAAGPGDFRKLVAIKRLLPQHALDPQLLRMFLDESRLMARFGHPNLPQVIDVSDGGGVEVPFFVMEHVAGVDLRDVLRAAGGALPVEHIVTIAAGVAAGLHHAHELRADDGRSLEIVHRDISPSNVLVSFDGTVKITDFGVAKWLQQKSFTYQGQLKGKFAHMSPEQCRGEPLDRRSDVFALGTLLYEMSTGRPAFEAETELELLSRIASEDAVWPRGPAGDLPEGLGTIIMRALRRSRDERFATTQEIQLAVEAWARHERLVASPVALAAYLASLFAARVAEWRAAPARTDERPLVPVERAGFERTATDTFALGNTLVSGETTQEAANLVEGGRVVGPAGPSPAAASPADPESRGSTGREDGGAAPTGNRGAGSTTLSSSMPAKKPSGRRQRVVSVAALGVAAVLAIAVYQLSRSNDTPVFEAAPPAAVARPMSGPTQAGQGATARTAATAPAVASPVAAGTSAPVARPTAATSPKYAAAAAEPLAEGSGASRALAPGHRDHASARAQRSRRAAQDLSRLALGPGGASPRGEDARDPEGGNPPTTTSPSAPALAPRPVPSSALERRTAAVPSHPVPTKLWDPDSPVPP
jgi:serine/threonine protein kinase